MAGGRIELAGLTKRFTEVQVDGIDLDAASGEFFSLLGPSGCGKPWSQRRRSRAIFVSVRQDPRRG